MAQQNSTSIYSAAVIAAVENDDYPAIEELITAYTALNALNTVVQQAQKNGINIEDYFPSDAGQYIVITVNGTVYNVSLAALAQLGTFMVAIYPQIAEQCPDLEAVMAGGNLQTS